MFKIIWSYFFKILARDNSNHQITLNKIKEYRNFLKVVKYLLKIKVNKGILFTAYILDTEFNFK